MIGPPLGPHKDIPTSSVVENTWAAPILSGVLPSNEKVSSLASSNTCCYPEIVFDFSGINIVCFKGRLADEKVTKGHDDCFW